MPIAHLANRGQERHVGQVHAELDDVGERGTGRRESEAQVLEDALGLGDRIARADQLALLVRVPTQSLAPVQARG